MNYRQASVVLREISPARIFARPTAEDLWLGPTRESVLGHLSVSAPLRILLGPVSSGRSSLLRHLRHESRANCKTLSVRGPQASGVGLLQDLVRAAGLNTEGLSIQGLRHLLGVYLDAKTGREQRLVIMLDDADTFGPEAWTELEGLIGTRGLTAGPELLMSMIHLDGESSPAAEWVRRQPSPVLSVLAWIEPVEALDYLDWRLRRFGLEDLMTPAAVRLIARCTLGRFAAIDHICQMALLLLRNRGGNQVNVNLIREAMQLLQLRQQAADHRAPVRAPARLIVSLEGKVVRQVALAERLLIGRSPLNDICLDSAYLSRHHVAVLRRDGSYFVSDLNSINGVSVNGEPVHYAQIQDGDVFAIGPFRVKLRAEEILTEETDDELSPAGMADTVMMPVPGFSEPQRLKVVR